MRRRAMLASLAALVITPTSAQTAEELEARNLETVRRYYRDVLNAHNPEAARGIIAADFQATTTVYLEPGMDPIVARETFAQERYAAAYSEYGWIEESIVADGPIVVWKGVLRGISRTLTIDSQPKVEDYPHLTWYTLNGQAQIMGALFAPIYSAEWYGQIEGVCP